jgi:hypothetical protein
MADGFIFAATLAIQGGGKSADKTGSALLLEFKFSSRR